MAIRELIMIAREGLEGLLVVSIRLLELRWGQWGSWGVIKTHREDTIIDPIWPSPRYVIWGAGGHLRV